jgi:flagellar biosynthesis protein FlhF
VKFKSYAGKDLSEIVPKIREELGPDAVILKQRKVQTGGLGGFFAKQGLEVLAADRAPADGAMPELAQAPTATIVANGHVDVAADGGQDAAALLAETFSQALQERVERLGADAELPATPVAPIEAEEAQPAAQALLARREDQNGYEPPRPRPAGTLRVEAETRPTGGLHIAPLPQFGRDLTLDEESEDLLLELERASVSPDVARALVEELRLHVRPFSSAPLRDLARDRIAARIRTEQGWASDGSARRIAIVGPSGVGKTSAIVRLAAAWAQAGLTVGLVSVAPDPEGEVHPLAMRLGTLAGSEAERVLAYIGGADLARAASPLDAGRAVQRFADRDVVLIDTPGVGVAPDGRLEAVGRILVGSEPHEVHAALPLGLAPREADAALAVLARLGADRVLVTKTDEARFAGPLLDLASRSDLPLSYLTTGPRIPGDLSPADGGSIARRILPI